MSFTDLALRFIIGGTLVTLVSWLSAVKLPAVAGLINLAPVITATTFMAVALATTPENTQEFLRHTLYTLPLLILFILMLFFFSTRLPPEQNLLLAAAIWFIAALAYIAFNQS